MFSNSTTASTTFGRVPELTSGQLDQVAGGLGISVVVRIKAATTVTLPDLRSIAQRDSPFETNDNLPG